MGIMARLSKLGINEGKYEQFGTSFFSGRGGEGFFFKKKDFLSSLEKILALEKNQRHGERNTKVKRKKWFFQMKSMIIFSNNHSRVMNCGL